MDTPLPLIPTPPRCRWRDFRKNILPPIVFASVVICIGCLWSSQLPLERGATQAPTASSSQTATNLVAGQFEPRISGEI